MASDSTETRRTSKALIDPDWEAKWANLRVEADWGVLPSPVARDNNVFALRRTWRAQAISK